MSAVPPPAADVAVGAATAADLTGILVLQRKNLRGARPPGEEARAGFLTVRHTPGALAAMAAAAPQVVARDAGGRVVGYALALVPALRAEVPVLAPFFDLLGGLRWRGAPLVPQRPYVMGQVCVDAAWRGRGVFDRLYTAHAALLLAPGGPFGVCVTEIAARNGRSLAAHARVGFEPVHRYDDPTTGEMWVVVGWEGH